MYYFKENSIRSTQSTLTIFKRNTMWPNWSIYVFFIIFLPIKDGLIRDNNPSTIPIMYKLHSPICNHFGWSLQIIVNQYFQPRDSDGFAFGIPCPRHVPPIPSRHMGTLTSGIKVRIGHVQGLGCNLLYKCHSVKGSLRYGKMKWTVKLVLVENWKELKYKIRLPLYDIEQNNIGFIWYITI